ncbi:MAG: hypothetical protein RJB03_792 [Bacteroidota bacterium]
MCQDELNRSLTQIANAVKKNDFLAHIKPSQSANILKNCDDESNKDDLFHYFS